MKKVFTLFSLGMMLYAFSCQIKGEKVYEKNTKLQSGKQILDVNVVGCDGIAYTIARN